MQTNITFCSCFIAFINVILFNFIECDCTYPKWKIPNGRFVFERRKYISQMFFKPRDVYMLHFECDAGYQRIGDRNMACLDDQWYGEVPVCTRMQCPDPPVFKNTEFKLHSGVDKLPSLGSSVTYTCNSGPLWNSPNSFTLHCVLDPGWHEARWKGEMPVCKELKCPDPPVVKNAEFKLHSGVDKLPTLGSSITYTCNAGPVWNSTNSSTLHCVLDPGTTEAKWKGEIPVCKEIICDRPQPPVNGNIRELLKTNQTSLPYGFRLTYACDEGYHLEGTVIFRTCSENGWSGEEPRCEALTGGKKNVMTCTFDLLTSSKRMDPSMTAIEKLDIFCVNGKRYFSCLNQAGKYHTGYNITGMAVILEGTVTGKLMNVLVNAEKVVEEICTEGTQLFKDFLASTECSEYINIDKIFECENKGKNAYRIFEEMHADVIEGNPFDETCMVTAYQLGCLGEIIHQNCGEEGYKIYKNVSKKIGFFKSGLCSPAIIESINTTFIDSLNFSESQRNGMYAIIQ